MADRSEEILVVNPGSTSTKAAVFRGEIEHSAVIIRHLSGDLAAFARVWDQLPYRLNLLRSWCTEAVERPSAAVALGGLLRPVRGGTYRVGNRMLEDARAAVGGEHASNLGCGLIDELSRSYGCPAFIVDPVSVDEFEPLARYSGHPLLPRRSFSHALSIHAVARRAAGALGVLLGETRLVVAHLGGGISVAAVRGGRIVDVNDAGSGGPFSPERSGTLPLQDFITLCYSGSHSEKEIRSMVMGKGGLVAYLGTNNAAEVEERIAGGDSRAREVYEAMAYQIAKEIGAMAAVLNGTLQAVVLTGGLASSTMLVERIKERTDFLGRLLVFPGQDEQRALAEAALRVLRKEEPALEYI